MAKTAKICIFMLLQQQMGYDIVIDAMRKNDGTKKMPGPKK